MMDSSPFHFQSQKMTLCFLLQKGKCILIQNNAVFLGGFTEFCKQSVAAWHAFITSQNGATANSFINKRHFRQLDAIKSKKEEREKKEKNKESAVYGDDFEESNKNGESRNNI